MTRHQFLGFRHPLALALLLAVAAGGCGGRKAAAVQGKVTYRGAALSMGTVVLVSEDGQTTGTGQVKSDGTYQIAKAPTGKVKAGVANPPPIGAPGGQPLVGSPNDEETKQARARAAKYVPTPKTYADPQKSGLSYEVPPGGGTIDIDLK